MVIILLNCNKVGSTLRNLDLKLFYLKEYLMDNEFRLKDAAVYLDITERHLSRLLSKWDQENIIDYKHGRGRGNTSKIIFKKNIETMLLNDFFLYFDDLTYEDVKDILNLPITDGIKRLIIDEVTINMNLFKKNDAKLYDEETLVLFYPTLPKSFDESAISHLSLMELKHNTLSRLYHINEHLEIIPKLVLYDEWLGNDLVIYLRKDVKFCDGSLMTSNDVKERLIDALKYTKKIKSLIIDIEAEGMFKLIVKSSIKTNFIKCVFANLEFGIYKKSGEHFITTGPFFIKSLNEESIVLEKNSLYPSKIGDVERVIMTSNHKRYLAFLKNNQIKNVDIEHSEINEYILANPSSNTLDEKQRAYFMHLLYIYKMLNTENDNLSEPQLIDEYYKGKIETIEINEVITIACNELVKDTSRLVTFLKEHEVNVIIVPKESNEASINEDFYWGVSVFEHFWYTKIIYFDNYYQWFNSNEVLNRLFKAYVELDIQNPIYEEEVFQRYLLEHSYFFPLETCVRQINVPMYYENVRTNGGSILEFCDIAVKRE